MTEKSAPDEGHRQPTLKEIAESTGAHSVQPVSEIQDPMAVQGAQGSEAAAGDTEAARPPLEKAKSLVSLLVWERERERESVCVCLYLSVNLCAVFGWGICVGVCVCVCVCVYYIC